MVARLLVFKATVEWSYRTGSRLSSNPTNPTVLMFSFVWINPLQIVISFWLISRDLEKMIFIILPILLLLGRNGFAEVLTSPLQKSHLLLGISSKIG